MSEFTHAEYFKENFNKLNEEINFDEYLKLVKENPRVLMSAHQRLYEMIVSAGVEYYKDAGKTMPVYKFFTDEKLAGKNTLYGVNVALKNFMEVLHSAASGGHAERRIILLHGPVGSAKSTIMTLIKKGLEKYSMTDEGALYSFSWVAKLPDMEVNDAEMLEKEFLGPICHCPLNEEPLKLLFEEDRKVFLDELRKNTTKENKKYLNPKRDMGSLCPICQKNMNTLLKHYQGNLDKALKHVVVRRVILSENNHVGIATFQPRDPKSQDATELTGDTDYRMLMKVGSKSDPRAFDFQGALERANRGIMECVEMLKMEVDFLYEFLSIAQERKIKPRGAPFIDVDEIVIGHTNNPDFERLKGNEFMEAFKDRTLKIDVPYVLRLTDEIKIYVRDYYSNIGETHLAPHTLEVGAMFAVLGRLTEPRAQDKDIKIKMYLYNGQAIEGCNDETVRELHKEGQQNKEGFFGPSPRLVQNALDRAIVTELDGREGKINRCRHPYVLIREIGDEIKRSASISDPEEKKRLKDILQIVMEEYNSIAKNEIIKILSSNEQELKKLENDYINNVKAYVLREKMLDPFTGQNIAPDENFMRQVEEHMGISPSKKDAHRQELLTFIGAKALEHKVNFRENDDLRKALIKVGFERNKHLLKLVVRSSFDADSEKVKNSIAERLKKLGYCDVCAVDVISHAASLILHEEENK